MLDKGVFRGVALQVGPWLKLNEAETVITNVRGPFYELFSEILFSLKLNYTMEISRNKVSGIRLPNGSWTGIIGSLQRKEVDAFVSPMVYSEARLEVVQYSNLVVPNVEVILGATPEPPPTDLTALVMAFDAYIWMGLLISLVVLIFVSGLHIEQDQYGVRLVIVGQHEFYTLISYFVAAFFLEGTPRDPSSVRGRFIYGIWWLMMLVLANGFCGNLRAMMMAPKEVFRVESLEHLAQFTDKILPITWKNTAFEDYFRRGVTRTHQTIWKAIQDGGGSKLISEMFSPETFQRLVRGDAVLVNGLLTTKSALGSQCSSLDIGNMYFGKEPFNNHILACGFRRGLDPQLIHAINKRVRWMFECHVFQHWLDTENREFERCMEPRHVEPAQPLTLRETKDLFLMYLTCLSICPVSLIIEIIKARTAKRHEKVDDF